MPCAGTKDCKATVHIHGCFADFGVCESPEEHKPRLHPTPGTECAFPACDCPGDVPVCCDYELAERQRLGRILGGRSCPVHQVPEPCPTCSAYIAGGL